jgi:hypothetical protein
MQQIMNANVRERRLRINLKCLYQLTTRGLPLLRTAPEIVQPTRQSLVACSVGRMKKSWSWQRFGAEAMLRQGRWELILHATPGSGLRQDIHRSVLRKSSLRMRRTVVLVNRRQLLLGLIKTRGDKGKWFAAAN